MKKGVQNKVFNVPLRRTLTSAHNIKPQTVSSKISALPPKSRAPSALIQPSTLSKYKKPQDCQINRLLEEHHKISKLEAAEPRTDLMAPALRKAILTKVANDEAALAIQIYDQALLPRSFSSALATRQMLGVGVIAPKMSPSEKKIFISETFQRAFMGTDVVIPSGMQYLRDYSKVCHKISGVSDYASTELIQGLQEVEQIEKAGIRAFIEPTGAEHVPLNKDKYLNGTRSNEEPDFVKKYIDAKGDLIVEVSGDYKVRTANELKQGAYLSGHQYSRIQHTHNKIHPIEEVKLIYKEFLLSEKHLRKTNPKAFEDAAPIFNDIRSTLEDLLQTKPKYYDSLSDTVRAYQQHFTYRLFTELKIKVCYVPAVLQDPITQTKYADTLVSTFQTSPYKKISDAVNARVYDTIKDLNQLGDAKDALFSIVNDISQSKTPKLKDFLALVAYYATDSFT